MDGLEGFLSTEAPAEEVETTEAPETEAVATEPVEDAPKGPVRDEKGRFAPKGEDEEPPFDHAATIGERRRRQEAEARAEAAERQLAQLQQQPPPSIWEDEQGWQQHFGQEVVTNAVQQASLNARLDMSEMMVRQSHTDFEDKKAAFITLMQETPGLQQKALGDPHPWNFAYNYVANHQRMQELSATNVTELEARLREQIKAELTAKPVATPPIPDTLADAQSARGGSTEGSVAAPTFDQILSRSKP